MKTLLKSIKSNWLQIEEQHKVICSSICFSFFLLVSRMWYTSSITFVFLLWNLFLAILPWMISSLLQKKKWVFKWDLSSVLLVSCWLVLLPNSFYIITDLFHLHLSGNMPLWFDLALLFSFAWNGLLLGVLSMRQMEKMVAGGSTTGKLFIPSVMFLNALGIYIGRYLRFNSWDVITNPLSLANEIFYLLLHPLRNRFDWSMIICFSIMLWFTYQGIRKPDRSVDA